MTSPASRSQSPRGFEVTAFDALLQAEPKPLLVGGQAVNLWAQVFLPDWPELQTLKPFVSLDCDLYGDAQTLRRLARRTGWKLTLSPRGQASPVVGYLSGQDAKGRDLLVEVLFTLKGLSEKDLCKETLVELGGKTYRTLSPITLLRGKLANYVELPQHTPAQERNDIKHLRILVLCVAGYLTQAHEHVERGRFTERSLVKLLEETLQIVTGKHALKAAQAERIDFRKCFPPSVTDSSLLKVQNFVKHRLAPLL